MAGHSKWANIKHRKAAVDAKRGKMFTKLIRELTVASKEGGPDADSNPRLRAAINTAKGQNMPNDTIDRAIKRGSGDMDGVVYQEVFYEGYGPGGSAVYVQALTDNKNRTVAAVRSLFHKNGGNLGETGCVAWIFEMKGRMTFNSKSVTEDQLFEIAIDAGAEDVTTEDNDLVVITNTDDFENVKKVLKDSGLEYDEAEVTMVPQSNVKIDGKEAERMIRLMEALEDSDDVQNVYANFDISEELLEALG